MLANASIQNTTTLEGLLFVALDDLPAYRRRFFDDRCWLGASRCSSCFAAAQFRCHTVFLKISHYGVQHLDVVWGRSLVVASLS